MNYKLGKNYKLCSKTTIQSLFDSGTSIKSYPFVAIYKEIEFDTDISFKVVFSAPKRTFRKAVQRNAIKRKSKEAFRLNKNILESYLKKNNTKSLCFWYIQLPKNLTTLFFRRKSINYLIKSLRK